MAKVSVVIPSYNHAAFIADAVNSVLVQTEGDLELIVVDDGSDDNSLEILAGFSDPRLSVLTQANSGAHAAINRGLGQASSGFIAILNSDDVYHPRRLEALLDQLARSPQSGVIGSYVEVIDSSGRPLDIKRGYENLEPWALERPSLSFRADADPRGALLTENYWATTSNFVFRRELVDWLGGFRPLRYAHDWDFLLRVLPDHTPALLPEPLLKYRVHPKNTIREDRAAMILEICWCLAVHLPRLAPELFPEGDPSLVEKLLYSIYNYGFDRVLAVMMVEGITDHETLALDLLRRESPRRGRYIAYIEDQLERQRAGRAREVTRPWRAVVRQIARLLPSGSQR